MKVLASARRENDGSASSKLDMYMTELSAIESELEATKASLGGPKRTTRKTTRTTETRRSKGKRKIHPAPQPSQMMMPHLESALGKDKERSLRCNASKPSIASSDAGNLVDDDLVELAETAAPEPESNETAKRITESTRMRSPARRCSRRPSPGKPQHSISKSPESTRDELKRLKMRQAALDAEARAHADAIRAEQRKTDKIHRERRASREIARKVEANRRFKASLQLHASTFRSTSSSSSTGTSSGTSTTSRAGSSLSSALDVVQASSEKKSSRLRPKSARRPKPSCNKGEGEARRPATASETHTKKSSHKQQHQKQARTTPTSAQVRPLIQQQTDLQWTKQEQPAWKKTWDILEHGSASPRARPRSSRSAGSSSSFQSSRSSEGSEMESAQPLSDRSEATDFGPRSSETMGTELNASSIFDRKGISGDGNESALEGAMHEKKHCAKPSQTEPLGGGNDEDDADENILGEHQDPTIQVRTMDSIEQKDDDFPIEIKAANASASPSRKDVPEGAQEEVWQEKGTIPEVEVERHEVQSDSGKKDAEEEEEEEVQTGFMNEVNQPDEDANKSNEDAHLAQRDEHNHEEVQATRLQQERQSLASQPDASLAAALVALSEAEKTVCQGQNTQSSPESPSCSEKVDKMRSELYGSEWRATFPDFQSCTSRICQDLDELTIQMGRKMQFVTWDDSLEDEYRSLFGTKDGQARQMDANGGTFAAAASAAAEGAAASVVAAKGAADAARGAAAAAEGAASAADAVTALADDLRVAAEAANFRWGVEPQHQSAGIEKEEEPHGAGSVAKQADHATKQAQETALGKNVNDATVTRTGLADSESLQHIADGETKQIVEDTEAFALANEKEHDAEQTHTEEKLNDGFPQNVEKQVSSTSSTPVAASGDLQVDPDELERNTGDTEVAPEADSDNPAHSVENTDEVERIPNASAKHTDIQNDKGFNTTVEARPSNANGESPSAKDDEVPRRRKTLW